MSVANIIGGFFNHENKAGTKPDPEDDSIDMAHHIRAAYALLCDANKRAIQVPPDVVMIITEARKYIGQKELPNDLEQKFWNVYGLLSSSIRPTESARKLYRNIFYGVLAVLL